MNLQFCYNLFLLFTCDINSLNFKIEIDLSEYYLCFKFVQSLCMHIIEFLSVQQIHIYERERERDTLMCVCLYKLLYGCLKPTVVK